MQAGYDITLEEMLEAEKEYRAVLAAKTDELTADELEAAAGGDKKPCAENRTRIFAFPDAGGGTFIRLSPA